MAKRKTPSCHASRERIASGACSHNVVLPSMSEKRKVTVPVGSIEGMHGIYSKPPALSADSCRSTTRACNAASRGDTSRSILAATLRSAGLIDHPVRARKDRRWDDEAERLGGLHVDHQLEFRRLLDRQVGWLGAFQNLVDE